MARETDGLNQETRERFRALAERLSNDELTRTIDPPWTAAGLMAHVAFWDRYVHARWRAAADAGGRTPAQVDQAQLDLINDASLGLWNATEPRAAVGECLAAAEDLDRLLASLGDDVVEELVREGRERLVDRSLHRGEHLGTIEAAFPPA